MVRIGAAALNQTPLDWEGNVARIKQAVVWGQQHSLNWLALPELCVSGYTCSDAFFWESTFEKSWAALLAIAPCVQNIGVTVGLPLHYQGQAYNALAVIENGQVLGFYLKQHLAISDVYYEFRWFKPWPQAQVAQFSRDGVDYPIGAIVVQRSGYALGFEICEDMWQNDPKNRPIAYYAQQGTDIILSAHGSHYTTGKFAKVCKLVQESAQHYKQCYVYSNTLGNESGSLIFDGNTLIAGYDAHQGRLLAQGKRFSFEQIEGTYCDYIPSGTVNAVAATNNAPPKLLAPKAMGREEEFAQSAALGLWDYLRKSEQQGFVLSISGGSDSAICAVLVREMLRRALDALGAAGVRGVLPHLPPLDEAASPAEALLAWLPRVLTMVYQPSVNSSAQSKTLVQALSTSLGIPFIEWSIDDLVAGYTQLGEKALGRSLNWAQDNLVLQNIQARVRLPGLWLLAGSLQAMVLCTSNRSEISVGYGTMDADIGGSLAPLAAVSKIFVQDWLHWAAQALHLPVLSDIAQRAPSAELKPHTQLDEQELMPYALLNALEEQLVQHKVSPDQLYKSVRQAWESDLGAETLHTYVQKFLRLFRLAQWKRERIPMGLHLGDYNLAASSGLRFPTLVAPLDAPPADQADTP